MSRSWTATSESSPREFSGEPFPGFAALHPGYSPDRLRPDAVRILLCSILDIIAFLRYMIGMRWRVETLNAAVVAEIEALPVDMRARLSRLSRVIEETGLRTCLTMP